MRSAEPWSATCNARSNRTKRRSSRIGPQHRHMTHRSARLPLDSSLETGTSEQAAATFTAPLLVHGSGLRGILIIIETQSGGERAIAGIASIALRSDSFTPPPRALLAALASALLENDDVQSR